MNRDQWKAFSLALRSKSREHKAKDHRYGALRHWMFMDHVNHGFTHWTIRHDRGAGNVGLSCYPSIIRDRSPSSRIDDALDWAAHYRLLARKERHMRRNHIAAAKACIVPFRFGLSRDRSLVFWFGALAAPFLNTSQKGNDNGLPTSQIRTRQTGSGATCRL